MRARLEQSGPSIATAACGGKKIGILVVAYNAVTTLTKVLRRIPADAWENLAEVVVFDDASQDSTYELAVGFKTTAQIEKLNVIRNLKNLGYGGNQKAGYRYFIERGFDIVVLLHGDGQYAPEALAAMYGPLVNGEAEAVFGSRMLKDYGGPLKGGMPFYKYAGNRILTTLENAALGMHLSEFHSGYRAYDLHALAEVDFSAMTDDFHFDTEIIIKLNHLGFRIKEVPIPTYYGDEICYVNGMKYAGNVVRSVYRYRRTVRAIRPSPEYREFWVHYPVKESRYSSHYYLRQWAGTGHRILDIGCGEAFLSAEVARMGNRVTGIDILPHPRAEAELEQYVECDLADDVSGAFAKLRGPYDKILLMDVLEHLPHPERMLEVCRPLLAAHGQMIVSIPNIANITTRLLLLAGRFDYTEKGLLDRTHLRFFTRKTARRLLEENGYEIVREVMTNIPVELGLGLAPSNRLVRAMHRVLRVATRMFGGLFGYQTMLTARKRG